MKKGETRAMYEERKRLEYDDRFIRRLESDERFLVQQLERVRRQIAETRAHNQTGKP